ncbi:hypothetical protein [Fontivita pretiosa]|uniref:hypothetical protein n=1 Tax=Fontivita pretiosa TaxID=2989684 RepID=UPI003D17A6F4
MHRPGSILVCLMCLFLIGTADGQQFASQSRQQPQQQAQRSARRALNLILPEIKFENVSLVDAIEFLRDVSAANIHVNWNALEAVGVGRDTIVNVRLRAVPLRKVLGLVLSEAGSGNLLTYYIDEDVIEITTREIADQQLITRVYPVDDLLMEVPDFIGPDFQLQSAAVGGGGGGQQIFTNTNDKGEKPLTRAERAQQLVELIQATIQPEVWNVNGGRAAIRVYRGSLIVTAPRSVHEALGG